VLAGKLEDKEKKRRTYLIKFWNGVWIKNCFFHRFQNYKK